MTKTIALVWIMAEICDLCSKEKPVICFVSQKDIAGLHHMSESLVPLWLCGECSTHYKVGDKV